MESRISRLGHVPWKPVIFALSLGLIALGFIAATTILPGPPITRAILVSATNVDTFTSKGFQVGTDSVNVAISVDSGGAMRIDGTGIRNNGWQKVSGVSTNIGVFYADGGLVAGQTASSGPSYVRLADTVSGNYWQWSTVGSKSNVIELTPTNGNMGLNWGIKVWTNVAYAADGTPTNQSMNFQLGAGLSVDWANRQITASSSASSPVFVTSMSVPPTVVGIVGHSIWFNGTNVNWAGSWLVDEDFAGNATTGQIGSESWATSLTGGGSIPLTVRISEGNHPGQMFMRVTNVSDRAGITINSGGYCIVPTNQIYLCHDVVKLYQTNDASDSCRFMTGIGSNAAFTNFLNGIGWVNTNGFWDLVTSLNSSWTHNITPSNYLANTWYYRCWICDGSTNVWGYIGGSPTNMTLVATNNANVPGAYAAVTTLLAPIIVTTKDNGTTTPMTNAVDVFKIWTPGR